MSAQDERSEQGKKLKKRLKDVRKRKRIRHDGRFECEAMALKMHLVKIRETRDH